MSALFSTFLAGRVGQDMTWPAPYWTWDQGDGFGPVDLTGAAAVMTWKNSSKAVVLTLTQASGITLGGIAGTIAPYVSSAQTTAIGAGFYTWTLLLIMSDGTQVLFAEGTAQLS